ncbi:outer membrane beta-barrel protein [Flavobacterium oreochromis]|uniref:Outer membrane protein beta-barrel domain-containing protein n=1 Tax=Flavobacterium columnare TaxID=996 RepID=A0A246G9E0_9FLAO|nr:outer membrane beta-barrel protein [Flavobacterium oreochromis]OWP76156.1 hypothetical protein BWK62_10330 [Flavobacterium oreochromis]
MQQLKQIIFLLFIIGNSIVTNAQFVITGKLMKENNQPITMAEVILLTSENKAIISQLINEQGDFKLISEKGNYTIQIKQLETILIEKSIKLDQDINLGILYPEITKKLNEVSIITPKKIIERKVDRVVFNVQNSTRAASGDALEALKVTPGIQVQNDGITMIGKSRMGLMIDGRLMQLSGDDLTNYLKTISADNIKSIEVITTPPAKYSAEGNSGLVNIILKKTKNDNWNASIRTNFRQSSFTTGGLGTTFTYKKNKNSFVISTLYSNGSYKGIENSTIYYPNQQWQNRGEGKYYTNVWSNRLGYDYQINKKWSIGIQYIGNVNKPNIDDSSKVTLTDNITQQYTGNISSKGESKRKKELNSFNFHSNIDLDTIGRKLSIDIDYLAYKSNVYRDFNTITLGLPISGFQSTLNKTNQNINNISTQLDMQHPLKWINLNYGMRFSFSNTKNSIDLFDTTTGALILDTNQSNIFEFKENTQAVYISGNKSFDKEKWETQIGLRVENTQTMGNSISNNFELNFNYKDNIGSSFSFSKETNNFGQVVILSSNEYLQKVTQLNYFDSYNIAFNQMINYRKKSWWENQNSIYIYFQHSDSKVYPLTPISNEGFGAQVNTNNNFVLNKNKTISAGFDLSYTLPYKSGDLVYNYGRTLISLYGKASFLEKKLQATITIENVLKTNDINTLSIRNNIDTKYKGYYDSRYINLQLVYKWGSTKINSKNRKVSNEEEKNRTN